MMTGCAGGGIAASGTYYGEMNKKGNVTDGIITLDGDTLTWAEVSCDDVSTADLADNDTSVGTLDKDRAMVAWTTEGRFTGSDTFTESEDGSVITMGDYTFSKAGTTAADALVNEIEAGCVESAERKEKFDEAQAIRDERGAEIEALLPELIPELVKIMQETGADPMSGDTAFAEVLEKHSLTSEEFAEYLRETPDVQEQLYAARG